jgi:hypothetical protein
MAFRTLPFLRKRQDPAAPVQAFVRHWFKQFKLYSHAELKAGAALVADAWEAHRADRALAAKFMLITTALKRCSRTARPSQLKRYFLLPGDTGNCTRHFLSAPFPLPDSISDAELLDLLNGRPYRGRSPS